MAMLGKLKKYSRETLREGIDKVVRGTEGVESPTVEEFLKQQGL